MTNLTFHEFVFVENTVPYGAFEFMNNVDPIQFEYRSSVIVAGGKVGYSEAFVVDN